MSTFIDVQIDVQGTPQNIGNCPYELRNLIRDQGLDCVFGRKDHQDQSGTGGTAFIMFEALERLSQELTCVVGLWATRLVAGP
jgi:hypothetical protein